MVYRAFFRTIDINNEVNIYENPLYSNTVTDSTNLQDIDPFRDMQTEFKTSESRVQVVAMNNTWKTLASTVNPTIIDGMRFHSTTDLFDGKDSSDTTNSSIPGMFLRQGQQKILWLLWLNNLVTTIYKDNQNTHLCLLHTFDIEQRKNSVKRLWWSLLAIDSQIDRNNRWLFGDNAYQITLPAYRNNKMLWLLQYRNDRWYVQIDKDRYESWGKDSIKNAFWAYYSK